MSSWADAVSLEAVIAGGIAGHFVRPENCYDRRRMPSLRCFSLRPVGTVLGLFVWCSAVSTPASAQSRYDPSRYEPARGDYDDSRFDARAYELPVFVSFVEGYAELARGGQSSRDIENIPLVAGDTIRTTRGRVELLFDDGRVIALDEHTTLTMLADGEADLVRGRVRVLWRGRHLRRDLTFHTAAGQAVIRTDGDYRITLAESRRGEAEIELAVAEGAAELVNEFGRTAVRPRTRALTTASFAPSVPYAFSPPRDEFERWSDGLELDRYGRESVRYLPTELRYYGGVFDHYGTWQRHAAYGWVWYPRVGSDWRPYSGGRWTFVVGFGYSWVGGSRWSWPTHHHGRWDRLGNRWFWIPVRPTQPRVVGYAVPRTSYQSTVTYYQPAPPRQSPVAARPGARPAPPPAAPSQPAPSQAVPRQAVPRQSGPPRAEPPARQEPARAAAPPTESRAPSRSAAPRSDGPPPSASRPAPQRSAPPAASAPPPSGSRTPSRTAPPTGGDSRKPSGTAVRRGGDR